VCCGFGAFLNKKQEAKQAKQGSKSKASNTMKFGGRNLEGGARREGAPTWPRAKTIMAQPPFLSEGALGEVGVGEFCVFLLVRRHGPRIQTHAQLLG